MRFIVVFRLILFILLAQAQPTDAQPTRIGLANSMTSQSS